jgi:hypothetical protein
MINGQTSIPRRIPAAPSFQVDGSLRPPIKEINPRMIANILAGIEIKKLDLL